MRITPKVFISATSGDLGTYREKIKNALLTLGCMPVEQTHFPPDHRTVREMLEEKVSGCDALIHVAGMRYGAEPKERKPNEPRRSYTQMEYHAAKDLGIKVFTFICPEDFAYDKAPAESEDFRELQLAHRKFLEESDTLFMPVEKPEDLAEKVREIQLELDALKQASSKSRNRFMAVGICIALTLLLMLGYFVSLKKNQEKIDARQEEMAAAIGKIQAAQETRNLIREFNTAMGRLAQHSDIVDKEQQYALALSEVAARNGIPDEKLKAEFDSFLEYVRTSQAPSPEDLYDAQMLEQNFTSAAQTMEDAAASDSARAMDCYILAGDARMASFARDAALGNYEKALMLVSTENASVVTARIQSKIGYAQLYSSKYREAEAILKTAIETFESTGNLTSEDDRMLQLSVYAYAVARSQAGMRLEAVQWSEKYDLPEKMFEGILGDRPLVTSPFLQAVSLRFLGRIYLRADNVERAESILNRLYDFVDKKCGGVPGSSAKKRWLYLKADILNDIGNILYDKKEDVDGALKRYEEALSVRRRIFEEFPVTAGRLGGVADCLKKIADVLYYEKEDIDGALKRYEEALSIKRRIIDQYGGTLDRYHDIIDLLNSIAMIKPIRKDFDANLANHREQLKIRERIVDEYGETASRVSFVILLSWIVGDEYLSQGENTAQALDALHNALVLQRKAINTYGETLERVEYLSGICTSMAKALVQKGGSNEEAMEYADEAVLLIRGNIESNGRTASRIKSLGSSLLINALACEQAGDLTAAESHLSEALTCFQESRVDGEADPELERDETEAQNTMKRLQQMKEKG